MRRNGSPLNSSRVARTLLVIALGSLTAVAAWAQSAYFSGPSISKVSAPAKFSGKGFAPNTSVMVMVKAPGGTESGYSAVTGADGAFSYQLVPNQTGPYSIKVADSGGRPLATAALAVLP